MTPTRRPSVQRPDPTALRWTVTDGTRSADLQQITENSFLITESSPGMADVAYAELIASGDLAGPPVVAPIPPAPTPQPGPA